MLRRGKILTLWATIEQAIDTANSIAWELSGRTVSKVVPQSFRWKIQLFKALHKKVAPFYGLADIANAIILKLEAQKPLRDLMAHGLLHPNQPKWTFTLTTFEKDGSLGSVTTCIATKRFQLCEDELLAICGDILKYTAALKIQLAKNPLDDLCR